MTRKIEKYTALIMQPHVYVAEDRSEIKRNVDRALQMIDFGVGYHWELPARLAVFPEYFMQGVTTPGKGEHGIDSFMKKAITFDGPEFKALSDKAREYLEAQRWPSGPTCRCSTSCLRNTRGVIPPASPSDPCPTPAGWSNGGATAVIQIKDRPRGP